MREDLRLDFRIFGVTCEILPDLRVLVAALRVVVLAQVRVRELTPVSDEEDNRESRVSCTAPQCVNAMASCLLPLRALALLLLLVGASIFFFATRAASGLATLTRFTARLSASVLLIAFKLADAPFQSDCRRLQIAASLGQK
jgi:hypothetical protein